MKTDDPAGTILATLKALYEPGDVTETRIFTGGFDGTISGYFDDIDILATVIGGFDGKYNVYVTLNPVDPVLLARAKNRFVAKARTATGDGEITCRRWLFFDADPKRPVGISSTDAQKALALAKIDEIKEFLAAQDWSDPIFCDSGNGYHLLYPIDLPNDADSLSLVQGITTAVADVFNDERVELDRKVFNASRITKAYGTLAMKGDSTAACPHRRSGLLEVPSERVVISLDMLKATLTRLTSSRTAIHTLPTVNVAPISAPKKGGTGNGYDMQSFIDRYSVGARGPMPYKGGSKWQLDECPFDSDHKAPDSVLYVTAAGAAAFTCSHNSCSGKDWNDVRDCFGDRTSARIGSGKTSVTETDTLLLSLDDLGNRERFVAEHQGQLLYSEAEGAWYAWDGRRWEKQSGGGAAMECAALTAARLRETAQTMPGGGTEAEAQKDAFLRHARSTSMRSGMANMVALARSHKDIAVHPDDFNPDPWLLNLANGTLNLTTRTLRAHDAADRITHAVDVQFAPGAESPTFARFIRRILPDEDVRRFVQKFLAYSVTGDTSQQCFLFLYGGGANGKSTLLNFVSRLMGNLHFRMSSEVFMARTGDQARFAKAEIIGRRLLTASEVQQHDRINESLIKEITGEDPIQVERKFERPFSVVPMAKLIMAGNHKPVIRGTDLGIWRRVRLIPFTVTIPEAERDGRLPGRLWEERSGILNWLLEGLSLYQAEGMVAPNVVLAATDDYRADNDLLGQFVQDRCVTLEMATVTGEVLYRAYRGWCDDTGHFALGNNVFARQLQERSYTKKKGRAGAMWQGIGLVESSRAESPRGQWELSQGGRGTRHEQDSLTED